MNKKKYPDNTELWRRIAERKAAMTPEEKQAAWERLQPMIRAVGACREKWKAERTKVLNVHHNQP